MSVSVAIGTYNRAAMVREAVRAALSQSRPPDEVIVSDDASPDGTFEMLTRLASRDARLRVYRQDTNLGGALNASFAVDRTIGDFIAWCSDDDHFLPDHLEESVAYLEAHPDTGLVHSGFVDAVEIDNERELRPRPLRSLEPLVVDRHCLVRYLMRYYNWPIHPSTIVMRRSVWESVGPFDPTFALSDTDWFVRAAGQFRTVLLPRHGVINRRHAGNWSNRIGSARMQQEIFEIVERRIPRRRVFQRAAWRANVRLRLAMTLHARLRTGHVNAACAAWHALLQETGRSMPQWLERAGAGLISRWCARREPSFEDRRQSVSPL